MTALRQSAFGCNTPQPDVSTLDHPTVGQAR